MKNISLIVVNFETESRLIILSKIVSNQQRPLCEKIHISLTKWIPLGHKIAYYLGVDPRSREEFKMILVIKYRTK